MPETQSVFHSLLAVVTFPVLMRDDILQVIEMWKLQKPSIYTAEIRIRLLLEGICSLDDLPSIDAVNKIMWFFKS